MPFVWASLTLRDTSVARTPSFVTTEPYGRLPSGCACLPSCEVDHEFALVQCLAPCSVAMASLAIAGTAVGAALSLLKLSKCLSTIGTCKLPACMYDAVVCRVASDGAHAGLQVKGLQARYRWLFSKQHDCCQPSIGRAPACIATSHEGQTPVFQAVQACQLVGVSIA